MMSKTPVCRVFFSKACASWQFPAPAMPPLVRGLTLNQPAPNSTVAAFVQQVTLSQGFAGHALRAQSSQHVAGA